MKTHVLKKCKSDLASNGLIDNIDDLRTTEWCMEESRLEFADLLKVAVLDKLNGGRGGCGMTVLAVMNMLPMPMTSPRGKMRPKSEPDGEDKPRYMKLIPYKDGRVPKMEESDDEFDELDIVEDLYK